MKKKSKWNDDNWPIGILPDGRLDIVDKPVAEMMKRDADRAAAQALLGSLDFANPGAAALELVSTIRRQEKIKQGARPVSDYLLRAATLDVVYAALGDDPPPSIVELMKLTLKLPGWRPEQWRIGTGKNVRGNDGRGSATAKPEVKARAREIDAAYLREHGKLMPVSEIALRADVDRKTARGWRGSEGWPKPRDHGVIKS